MVGNTCIAEHVWLLEKIGSSVTFFVFGNYRQVPLTRRPDYNTSEGLFFILEFIKANGG